VNVKKQNRGLAERTGEKNVPIKRKSGQEQRRDGQGKVKREVFHVNRAAQNESG